MFKLARGQKGGWFQGFPPKPKSPEVLGDFLFFCPDHAEAGPRPDPGAGDSDLLGGREADESVAQQGTDPDRGGVRRHSQDGPVGEPAPPTARWKKTKRNHQKGAHF